MGWLGWSPAVAMRATPAEITIAMAGRADMLAAIFGDKKGKSAQNTDVGAGLFAALKSHPAARTG